jgi:acyl dehydratase
MGGAGMTAHIAHLADLAGRIGQELGVSDWLAIDQARIDAFAEATGDHQWIHVDAERAASGPFGSTVAHGLLTLSLLPWFYASAYCIDDVRMGLNYGFDKVRFPAPVAVGSRLRARFHLLAFELLDGGGAQLKVQATIEREGSDKPVCVAESISRCFA